MTYIAEPAWGNTVDIAFDGLAAHETTNDKKKSSRNGGNVAGQNE